MWDNRDAAVFEAPRAPYHIHASGGRARMAIPYPTTDRITLFWSKVHRSDGCWFWQGSTNPDGYGNFNIKRSDGSWGCTKAHRFAWLVTHGQLPTLNVCHHCDTPSCVRPDHLFTGTQADNMRDCQRKGRYSHKTGRIGSAHQHAKLKERDIPTIRALRASGETFKAIAGRYGVSDSTIQNIFNGHTWGHVA